MAEAPVAAPEPDGLIDLLRYDTAYEVPAGWFAEFQRRVHGLAGHRDAFLFENVPNFARHDLPPIVRAAHAVLWGVVGPVAFDPQYFVYHAASPFLSREEQWFDVRFAPVFIAGNQSNWLGDLATSPRQGNPAPERVRATETLLTLLDALPPLEPLNARVQACRQVVSALLAPENRQLLIEGGFQDVYALVENVAEAIDADLLSDLCRPVLRMLRPVSVLEDVESLPGVFTPPPTAVQLAAMALQIQAGHIGQQPEIPEELGEVFGVSRARQLTALGDLEALQDQAAAWVEEFAAREDHHLVRRWLDAAVELNVRVQYRQDGDEVLWILPYVDLYHRYLEIPVGPLEAGDPAGTGAQHPLDETGGMAGEGEAEHPATWPAEEEGPAEPSPPPAPMDELNQLIGLEGVKTKVRRLANSARLEEARRRAGQRGLGSRNRHMLFVGNPGTGKTRVARLMAGIYQELGILEKAEVLEIKRADVVGRFQGHTGDTMRAKIEEARGGVLFIDEAYALKTGENDEFGQEAIDTLLPLMDEYKDDLVVIAAGYHEEMARFLETNPGLRRRFTETIVFEDYDDDELVGILHLHAEQAGFGLTEEFVEGFRRLIPRRRGRDFGNAGWVEGVLSAAIELQDERLSEKSEITQEDLLWLTKEDIPARGGTRMQAVEAENGDPLAELEAMEGLGTVKEHVAAVQREARLARRREELEGRAPSTPSRHLLLLGNPGTGKSTVAMLLARIYRQLGILDTGGLVVAKRSTLVEEHKGGSAKRTREAVEKALGGVLFIDEAYALKQNDDDDFGQEAIDTLVDMMEEHRDELVVIAAGYRDEVHSRFLRANPGLPRRFPREIELPDYSDDELLAILRRYVEDEGMRATDGFYDAFRRLIPQPRPADFGNAGWVRNMFEAIRDEHFPRRAERQGLDGEDLSRFTAEDVPQRGPKDVEPSRSARARLDGLIGIEPVKGQIKQVADEVAVARMRLEAGVETSLMPGHMLFLGNPGTGKTTVARLLGEILVELGVLSTGRVHEVGRAQLVGDAWGKSPAMTREAVLNARGGILFIDEAYSLKVRDDDGLGQEAIDTLVPMIEEHRHELLVIAAGYTEQMDRFLRANAGLSRRFPNRIEFPDYDVDELVEIFKLKAGNMRLSPGAEERLREVIPTPRPPAYGNGGAMENLLRQAQGRQATRLAAMTSLGADDIRTLLPEDLG